MGSDLTDTGFNPTAQAPAVAYPLSRPAFLQGVLVLVLCLALGMDLAWLAMASDGDGRPWIGLLATLAAAAWCGWHMPLTNAGQLSWDGREWRWEDTAGLRGGTIHLRLDTQSGLLVRFSADTGERCWIWLAQASDPGHWLDVRRAIHAHARLPGGSVSSARAPS